MTRDALVYVVDDDDAIRSGLRLLLESNGWKAETYDAAETCLLGYSPRRRACLLLDLDMPGMNGAELQAELASRGISLPIIIMTAHDARPVVRKVQEAGATAILRKPFRADALLPLIERIIANDEVNTPLKSTAEVNMAGLIPQLRVDHSNVSKVLNVLLNQLQAVTLEQAADYELMRDAMLYMTQYPDIVHHPAEELIFGFVVQHAPESNELIAELTREHAALVEKGTIFFDSLCHVVDGAMVERDLVTSRGHDYIQFLDYHMKKEEEHAFPLAEKVLLDADWRAVNDTMNEMHDPLFGPVVQDDYQSIYRFVTQSP